MNTTDATRPPSVIHWGDIVAIVTYFILVIIVGLWSTFRANKESASGYFLAGREMTWIPIGASIYASNVGAPMFIGLAGGAASSGIGITIFEWQAIFMLVLLGWIFVPVYIASGCYTMPEYLKKRFGGRRLRVYLAVLGLMLYVLTKISIEMYAGALFIQQILDWNLYLSIFLILAVTAVYTVAGGLTAVIYTDTLQVVILLIGSVVLMIIGFLKVGSYSEMKERYMKAYSNETWHDYSNYGNHTCGLPREDSFHIWRSLDSDLPWLGTTLGLTPIAMWVWCTDQVMVQRSLSAKNLSHAKGGSVLAAYLKILPFALFILPGMMSRILYPDEVACSSPGSCTEACGNPAGCTNVAYPWLVLRILPIGSGEMDTRPTVLSKVHFLHFSILLTGITTIVTIIVSLVTEPRPPEKLHRVTWWTRHDDDLATDSDDEGDSAEHEEDIATVDGHIARQHIQEDIQGEEDNKGESSAMEIEQTSTKKKKVPTATLR